MTVISQSPAYNLKVVLKETGLNADVLRAWERRYGLPMPHRTPGGHRLYSEYDIEIVKWLRERQAEGLSISRAVELWKETILAGSDPLAEHPPVVAPTLSRQLPLVETRIETLLQNWLEAIMAFDGLTADEILNQAFAIFPVETVCTEILQRGISNIGNYWYQDKVSVQQEHFASAMASRRLEALISATPRPTRSEIVLVGCPPGERHTFSILLLSLLLRRRGMGVVYLGADIPIERMKETAEAIKPDLIVLAAQQITTAASLKSAALAFSGHGILMAYGGLIFNRVPKLRDRIPAYFLGQTLDEAIHFIERLLSTPVPGSTPIKDNPIYQELARLYREKRPLIEIRLFEKLKNLDLQTEYIAEANYFFGNGLSAALELGDPSFLESDLEWVKQLLPGRQIPMGTLIPYLAAYSQSILTELGLSGIPITDWIDSYTAQDEETYLTDTKNSS